MRRRMRAIDLVTGFAAGLYRMPTALYPARDMHAAMARAAAKRERRRKRNLREMDAAIRRRGAADTVETGT